MNLTHVSDHLLDAFLRASSVPTHAEESTPPPVFTIAISRQVGAGGTAVAREVGRRLNWPVYDREILEEIAKDMRVGVHMLENVDERPVSWLEQTVAAFGSVPTVGRTAYFRRLLKVLLALGVRGECVIVGRGATHVLRPETTLRVRLVAEREDRIATIARGRGLSEAEAIQYIETTERERARFVQDHFKKDPSDPLHYDLILNSSRFPVIDCADLVIEALRRRQAHAGEHEEAGRKGIEVAGTR